MRGERGQVLPLVALVVVVACIASLVIGRAGAAMVDRAKAKTSADAAALAGVLGGEGDAHDVARANGGEVESFVEAGGEVEVRVRVGGSTAWARAASGGPGASASGTVLGPFAGL